MPGIRADRPAAGFLAHLVDVKGKPFFRTHDDQQYRQRPRRGQTVRMPDLCDALSRDLERGEEQETGYGEGRQRFRLAVSLRMVGVRWLGGDFEADQHQRRRHHVHARFDGIGDQRVGVPQNPGDKFRDYQQNIDAQPDKCRAHSRLRRVVFQGFLTRRFCH